MSAKPSTPPTVDIKKPDPPPAPPRLKPCPFCGSESVYCGERDPEWDVLSGYRVTCLRCCTVGPELNKHEYSTEAIAAWNGRADNWVSISRLGPPDRGGPYLTWDGANLEVDYFGIDLEGWQFSEEVTHWMPAYPPSD